MLALTIVLNKIHEWNQPESHPLKRMGFTRVGGIVCVILEAISLVAFPILFGIQIIQNGCRLLSKKINLLFPYWRTRPAAHKLFLGLISSVVFGIFVSPEVNFRIHLKLSLA